MGKSRLVGVAFLGSVAFFTLAGAAQSAPLIPLADDGQFTLYGSGSNDLPSGLTEQKIYLVKSGANGTTTPPGGDGTLAQNTTCSPGSACANFASTSVIDLADGFANIKPHTGDQYHDLTFTVPGYKFGDFLFDLQLFKSTDPLNLSVTVNGTSTFVVPGTALKHDADLSFALVADTSFFITSVLLSSLDANDGTVGFTETKHFQVSDLTALCANDCGGGGPALDPTPIPGALWLFGTVLAGGAGFGRWRRMRKQTA